MKISLLSRKQYSLVSKLFAPLVKRPLNTNREQDLASKSHQLMVDCGIINFSGASGLFHLLPVGTRALNKLIEIIDEQMRNVGANRLIMSSICPQSLLERTGRLELMSRDLFKFKDRNDANFALAPTHEEAVTRILSEIPAEGHSRFPLLLYQITNKFRDENHPRFGLLRGREFLMKDLYSFDVDESSTLKTYELVSQAYFDIFLRLQLPVLKVRASSGAMGGEYSHEFHLDNPSGQDLIFYCDECSTGMNKEIVPSNDAHGTLVHEMCGKEMKRVKTIEVAHTFVLGTKYTENLGAFFMNTANKRQHLHMACFGIGVSRLLAASIDCLSTDDPFVRWPSAIAPFRVCVVPPKSNSKEADAHDLAVHVAESLANLSNMQDGDVLFNDRTTESVGKRVKEARMFGCSYIVVVNKSAVRETIPKFELIDANSSNDSVEMTHSELFQFFSSV